MKRIGIFIFYDAYGKVDKYVEFLLQSMKSILQKQIIIINGQVDKTGYENLKIFSNDIFIRENLGYDAGGYKDVFTKFLKNEQWDKWDEIILFNDTFYGPLFSWEDVFERMKNKNVDFWGLSRFPGGEFLTGEKIIQHIQGYFLVCRKKLFLSKPWEKFWRELNYPEDQEDAIINFEIHFSKFFCQNGYQMGALTDDCTFDIEYGENPYLEYLYQLFVDIRFPIIKRKVFSLIRFNDISKAIGYVAENSNYDKNLMYMHIMRLNSENRMNYLYPFSYLQIETFYNKHKRVFIYGHGKYGQGIGKYFEYRGWRYNGFIVSDTRGESENVFEYKDIDFDSNDGIILALGKKSFEEVYPVVKYKFSQRQLLLPEYSRKYRKIILN